MGFMVQIVYPRFHQIIFRRLDLPLKATRSQWSAADVFYLIIVIIVSTIRRRILPEVS